MKWPEQECLHADDVDRVMMMGEDGMPVVVQIICNDCGGLVPCTASS